MLSRIERIEGSIRLLRALERRAREDANELRARRLDLEEARENLLQVERMG